MVVPRKDWDAGARYIERIIDARISSFAFGDSTAKRRQVSDDPQLVKALDVLKKGTTTKELLALATTTSGGRVDKPKQK
mgnify:FL=1